MWRVGEAHVVLNEGENLAGLVVGEAETAADVCADGDADLDVAVEADAVWRAAECWRLAHVVEQRSPGQGERAAGLKLMEQAQRVDEHISLRVVLRGLLDALHAGDFRKHLGEQAGGVEELEGAACVALGKHFGELVADTLAADGGGFGGEAAHGGSCAGLELETEAGGEADAAKHAEMVLLETGVGLADGAHDAQVEVGKAAHVVDYGEAEEVGIRQVASGVWGVKQKTVDGEIAALDILFGAGGVAHRIGMTAIGICAV